MAGLNIASSADVHLHTTSTSPTGLQICIFLGISLNLLGSLDLYLEVIRFDLETDIDTAGIGARWTF